MKAVRAMVVLIVTMRIWNAMYFKTAIRSSLGIVARFLPKPCFTESVRKTQETIARIYKAAC